MAEETTSGTASSGTAGDQASSGAAEQPTSGAAAGGVTPDSGTPVTGDGAESGAVPISAELPKEEETKPLPKPLKKVSGQSVIDPVNRIEGHLRIDMEVVDGVVKDAFHAAANLDTDVAAAFGWGD